MMTLCHSRAVRLLVVSMCLAAVGCGSKKNSSEGGAKPTVAADAAPAVNAPHPQYPTAESVGSHAIFTVGKARRGPLPKVAKVPHPSKLKVAYYDVCELAPRGIVCGAERKKRGRVGWKVSRGEQITVGERFRDKHRRDAVVLLHDGKGTLERMAILRPDGKLDWERVYSNGGARFTARARSGANQLDGCGSIEANQTRSRCLGWDGRPMVDARGVAETRWARNQAGFVTEASYWDLAGKAINAHDGVHRVQTTRDKAGRVVREESFDRSGAPVVSRETGCHGRSYEYDGEGRVSSVRCDNLPERKAPDLTRRYRYDRRGCRVGESYQSGGKPVSDRHGVYQRSWRKNARCFSTGLTCLGSGGKKVRCPRTGVPIVRDSRNANGDRVSRKYFDAKGKPARSPQYGIHEVRFTYDNAGRMTSESCFSEVGTAAECGRTGYHAQVFQRDDAGRVVQTRYRDLANKPTVSRGIAVEYTTYDDYDHIIEVKGETPEGKLHVERGMAVRKQLYDTHHRLAAVLLFDDKGAPSRYVACFSGVRCPAGRPWHAVRVVWGDDGVLKQNLYFDHDKQLIETIDCATSPCWPRR